MSANQFQRIIKSGIAADACDILDTWGFDLPCTFEADVIKKLTYCLEDRQHVEDYESFGGDVWNILLMHGGQWMIQLVENYAKWKYGREEPIEVAFPYGELDELFKKAAEAAQAAE